MHRYRKSREMAGWSPAILLSLHIRISSTAKGSTLPVANDGEVWEVRWTQEPERDQALSPDLHTPNDLRLHYAEGVEARGLDRVRGYKLKNIQGFRLAVTSGCPDVLESADATS